MSEIMLEIDDVSKIYAGKRGMFGRSHEVRALKHVSLSVRRGKVLAWSVKAGRVRPR